MNSNLLYSFACRTAAQAARQSTSLIGSTKPQIAPSSGPVKSAWGAPPTAKPEKLASSTVSKEPVIDYFDMTDWVCFILGNRKLFVFGKVREDWTWLLKVAVILYFHDCFVISYMFVILALKHCVSNCMFCDFWVVSLHSKFWCTLSNEKYKSYVQLSRYVIGRECIIPICLLCCTKNIVIVNKGNGWHWKINCSLSKWYETLHNAVWTVLIGFWNAVKGLFKFCMIKYMWMGP